jgi:hypothetical protein
MILYTSVQKVKTLLKLENTNLSQSKTMDHVNTSKTWWIPNKNGKHDKMDSVKKCPKFKS